MVRMNWPARKRAAVAVPCSALIVYGNLDGNWLDHARTAVEPQLIERFIAPTPSGEFFGNVYEQTWAYFPHNETPLFPQHRMTLADVTHWGMKYLEYGKSIEVLPHPTTKKEMSPAKGQSALATLHRAMSSGHSMVLNSLQGFSEPAKRLACDLIDGLSWPVDVYMYLTPPFSLSYGMHSDVMDAWMVQLEGSKNWTVCNPRPFSSEAETGKKLRCEKVTMQGGDVMYIPFGTLHKASTSEELSAHLTINIERQCFVWGNILKSAAVHAIHFLAHGKTISPDKFLEMGGFEMEGETKLERWLLSQMQHAPMLSRVPLAMHSTAWATVLPRSLGNIDLPPGYLDALKEELRLVVGQLEGLSAKRPQLPWAGKSELFDWTVVGEKSLLWALDVARVHNVRHLKGDTFFSVSAVSSLAMLRKFHFTTGSEKKAAHMVRYRRVPRARAVLVTENGPPLLWVNSQDPTTSGLADKRDALLFCLGQFSPLSSHGQAFELVNVPWSGSDKTLRSFIKTLVEQAVLEVVVE